MKPLTLVKFFSATLISSSLLLASCTKEVRSPIITPSPYSYYPSPVEMYLTSQLTSSAYTSVNLDLQGIEYNTSTEAGITTGWETVSVEQPGGIDLMGLLNGRSLRLSPSMIKGDVKQIRLLVGSNNNILKDGETHPLSLSQDIIDNGIMINTYHSEFGFTSSLWLNIDLDNSIHYDAVENVYAFVPSIKYFDLGETGSIEGYVTPGTSIPSIHLESDPNNRTDLIMSHTFGEAGNQGYFKFIGVPEGIYQVEIVANDGTYRSKLIREVEVKKGETNFLGLQELQ